MTGITWTPTRLEIIRVTAAAPAKDVARLLGCTKTAVAQQRGRLGLSCRGQPLIVRVTRLSPLLNKA